MNPANHSQIVSFVWNIANILRDTVKPGKRQDIILPMCVLRRLDAVLEPTKDAVLAENKKLKDAGFTNPDTRLRRVAKQAFYNTSKFTLSTLLAGGGRQNLLNDFNAYLKGFSPNVQSIMDNFHFRHYLKILSDKNLLGTLIQEFNNPKIDLSPNGLDNHGMGTIFEELVRRFNESNNEEAGEHWTPRDAVRLMARLVFRPVEKQITSGGYTIYDCACGTGGMLTIAEEELFAIADKRNLNIKCYLYGQETNPETLAICKADMLLKGEGRQADNIREHSTLSADAFAEREFDFMLSNPPYGKDWKSDMNALGGAGNIHDPRFSVSNQDEDALSFITRSSDGQMLFLANMVSKMKKQSGLGSRIAEVHNGSSLFTGDAGQGESNIRRWLIESDYLEAIVALPENMFYNTGIATYIWVLSNRKPPNRRGKVQLIDASRWSVPMRRNLGKKNCELSGDDIDKIVKTFLDFRQTPQSKIFPNKAFGYYKITVERPLRLRAQLSPKAINGLRFASGDAKLRRKLYDVFGDDLFNDFDKIARKVAAEIDSWNAEDETVDDKTKNNLLRPDTWARDARVHDIAEKLRRKLGSEVFDDYNVFRLKTMEAAAQMEMRLTAADKKALWAACSWRDENAPPVESTTHLRKKPNPLYGLFAAKKMGKSVVVEYESDSELRDSEQIPLLEDGGIEAFFRREVLPYSPGAWIKKDATKIGYEISFTRHFYKPQKMRALDDIRADIAAAQKEAAALMNELAQGKQE